jgi:hypothetical protein
VRSENAIHDFFALESLLSVGLAGYLYMMNSPSGDNGCSGGNASDWVVLLCFFVHLLVPFSEFLFVALFTFSLISIER